MLVVVQYFGSDMQTLAVGGVIGVIAAGAAVALMKPAIIVATSAAGAYALTMVIFAFLWKSVDYHVMYWPFLIGITAIGSVFQFLTTKHIS